MGTDLDFALELRKNKLVSMQFQQPVNQLEGMTEPTQQPNAEFILHLMRMLEQRFGNRMNNENDGPIAVVIQLGDNQRIIIAFPNHQRPRVAEPPRQRPFQRLMREIMEDGNDMIQDEDFRDLSRHRIRQPESEIQEPQRERIEERQQMIPEVQYQDREWDTNFEFPQRYPQEQLQIQRNPQESLQATILSRSLPHEQELRHQQRVVYNVKEQLIQKKQQQPMKKDNKLNEEHQFSPNPQSKQEFQSHSFNAHQEQGKFASLNDMKNKLDQTFIPLNHNQFNSVRNYRRQEQPVDQEVTCWQAFVRMINNLFRSGSF